MNFVIHRKRYIFFRFTLATNGKYILENATKNTFNKTSGGKKTFVIDGNVRGFDKLV